MKRDLGWAPKCLPWLEQDAISWPRASYTRSDSIRKLERATGEKWKTLYRRGYRMVRVGEVKR